MSAALKVTDCLSKTRVIPNTIGKVNLISVVPKNKRPLQALPICSLRNGNSTKELPHGSVSIGLGVPLQMRFVHTDVANFPDYTNYRPDSTKSPIVRSSESEIERKVFGYTMMFAGAVVVTTAAKYAVKTFIMPLGPTAKTLAEATAEVKISSIPEGKNLVVKWRNKPLFIRHRTEEEVARERAVPLSSLRHAERDEDRVKQDKWLICLGVCTHLGCVPIALAGDFPGGYYCPCHGSHYDASGRIRKGPAPLNLEIPEYTFVDDDTVLVG